MLAESDSGRSASYFVVLVELGADQGAEGIGALLGLSPYDVASRVLRGLPRVVLQTPSDTEARRVSGGLAARGHGIVLCEARDVVSSDHMVRVRRFGVGPEGLRAHDRSDDVLPWDDLEAVVVAAVQTPVIRLTTEVQRRDDATIVLEHTATERSRTNVAYLFPRSRDRVKRPWVLDEHAAQYMALGARMRPTRQSNFRATLDLLRDHSPNAVFDERLATVPRVLSRLVKVHDNQTATALGSDASLDVTVHALAEWLLRRNGGPYRG